MLESKELSLTIDLIEWHELPHDSHGVSWDELVGGMVRIDNELADPLAWKRFVSIYPEDAGMGKAAYRRCLKRLRHWYETGYFIENWRD